MASYRIPKEQSLFTRHSQCTRCKHPLSAKDLVPLFSWLLSKGKCRHCNTAISPRYPLIEITMGLAFLLISLQWGISYTTIILWLITVIMGIMILTDLEYYLLPDSTQLILLCLAIAYAFAIKSDFPSPLIGACFGLFIGIFLRKIGFWMKKQEALGWGDVKFLTIAGLFLGTNIELTAVFLLLSGISGIFLSIIWRSMGKGTCFPFGPALIMALWLCITYPSISDIFFHPLYTILL